MLPSLETPPDLDAVSRPLPETIYRRLRLGILDGTLPPGHVLRQEELAARFGVSRVPLREAMNRLEAEGLVVLRPRRGYAVTSLEPEEITEIFDLRMVIEEHAGTTATLVRTAEDVREVQGLLRRLDALDPDDPAYFLEWSRLNREFHARLFASSRRKRVGRIASALRDVVEPYIRVEARLTGHFDEAHREHRAIFEAFEAGDAARVGRLSRDHCENTAKRLLEALLRRRDEAPPGAR